MCLCTWEDSQLRGMRGALCILVGRVSFNTSLLVCSQRGRSGRPQIIDDRVFPPDGVIICAFCLWVVSKHLKNGFIFVSMHPLTPALKAAARQDAPLESLNHHPSGDGLYGSSHLWSRICGVVMVNLSGQQEES